MRKICVTMALSLVCAMSLHAVDELYGVMEDDHILKLYYDNQRTQRGGTTDWKTEFNSQTEIVSLDESIQYISLIDATTYIELKDFYNLVYIEHLDYYHFYGGTYGMFKNCRNLKWVDLSSFDFSNVLSDGISESMFEGCSALTTIYCDVDMSGDQIRFDDDMFKGCESLVGSNGTTFDASKVKSNYARPDQPGQPGYFTPTSQRIQCGLITSCSFRGFNQSAIKPGVVWTEELELSITAAIRPTKSNVFYDAFSAALWFDDETEGQAPVEYGTTLTEGRYIFAIGVLTTGEAYEHGQRFPLENEGSVTVTVDGKTWLSNATFNYTAYSGCNAEIEFNVTNEGVEKVQSGKEQSTKVLRDGRLIIERNGKTFTAQGAEIK